MLRGNLSSQTLTINDSEDEGEREGQMENRYNQALLITLSDLEELDRRYTGKIFSLAQPCSKVLHISMHGTANLLHLQRQM